MSKSEKPTHIKKKKKKKIEKYWDSELKERFRKKI